MVQKKSREIKIIDYSNIILDNTNSKVCQGKGFCGQQKHLDDFGLCSRNKDGKKRICKSCDKALKIYNANKNDKNNITEKICASCNVKKHISFFSRNIAKKDSHESCCKVCIKERRKKYISNLAYPKEFYNDDIEKECSGCNKVLNCKKFFYPRVVGKYGYRSRCRDCEYLDRYEKPLQLDVTIKEQLCQICGKILPLSFFDSTKLRRHTGKREQCKQCRSELYRKNKMENPFYTTGSVYLLHNTTKDVYKIGFSFFPETRIKNIKTLSEDAIVIVSIIQGSRLLERLLLWKYSDYRLKGEWFKGTKNLLNDFNSQEYITYNLLPFVFFDVIFLDALNKFKDDYESQKIEKICAKCNESKLLHLFNLERDSKDFLDGFCRICQKNKVQEKNKRKVVYLAELSNTYKIGKTDNITRRLSHLSGINGLEVKLLFLLDGYSELEKHILKLFKKYRVSKEMVTKESEIYDFFLNHDKIIYNYLADNSFNFSRSISNE